MAQMGLNMLVV